MIYVLRFFYAWLLPPGLFILIILGSLYFFLRTKRKYWLAVPLLLIYLLSISAVSTKLIKPLEGYYPQPDPDSLKGAQAIVVLGGGASDNVSDFNGKGQISSRAANRFLMALRLHKALNIPVILSGGQGYSRSATEAEIAARTLTSCGVEEEYLILEDRSRNTQENAAFTKKICQQKHLQKIILVTSACHLPRSVMLFQREDIDVIPYPADYRTSNRNALDVFSFVPSINSLYNTTASFKEYMGIFAIKTGLQ